MEVLYPRCAGLDVHKATVVAAVRLVAGGKVVREVRTFATTTAGLLELAEWFAESGCTHVAMEATGVYWRPVWHVLAEGGFVLVLANAAQVKNVPGRKTDVGDATWLAELLAHGLIRASFVPDGPTQELRSFLRTRKQLVRERASHVQRLQKTLEDANVKFDGVVTDLLGRSGRAMLEALATGEDDPAKLVALAHPGWRDPGAAQGGAARAGDGPPPLPAPAAPRPGRRAGRGGRPGRPRGRGAPRPLSRRGRAADVDPRHRPARGPGDRGRDRPRHGPLPDRRAPGLLGRAVPEERREPGGDGGLDGRPGPVPDGARRPRGDRHACAAAGRGLGLALAGCEHDPTVQDFANACQSYGFRPGTPEMAECVQRETLAWKQRTNDALYGPRPGWPGRY